MKKRYFIFFLCLFILAFTMGVGASSTIQAAITNYKVFINGKEVKTQVLSANKLNYISIDNLPKISNIKVDLNAKQNTVKISNDVFKDPDFRYIVFLYELEREIYDDLLYANRFSGTCVGLTPQSDFDSLKQDYAELLLATHEDMKANYYEEWFSMNNTLYSSAVNTKNKEYEVCLNSIKTNIDKAMDLYIKSANVRLEKMDPEDAKSTKTDFWNSYFEATKPMEAALKDIRNELVRLIKE